MANWDRVLSLLLWLYSAASPWLTASTVLTVYGLVLLYLIAVVHAPATTPQPSSRRRHSKTLVLYYNRDGQIKSWVREEPEDAVQKEMRPECGCLGTVHLLRSYFFNKHHSVSSSATVILPFPL
ncbi:hypothetical protein B0H13DRAFT_2324455 [Mycena leptocephala]|nr:hypothetical protein B0H13DRAFT_2324455 [Mycena leptocephala]